MSKTADIAATEARLAEMARRLETLAATVEARSRDNESLAVQAAEAQRDEALAQHDMVRTSTPRAPRRSHPSR